MRAAPTNQEHEAIVRLRLLSIARRSDTGQASKVADFLLAWWNAEECGGFDLVTRWSLDDAIVRDMVTVFSMIAEVQGYPDTLGYKDLFADVVKRWRPRS